MPQFFCNAKSDLSGAIASATMALPGNIIYGLIAFAPLGSEYAGQGILAGLYASVFAGFFAAVFGGAEGTISGPRAPTALVFGSFMGQLLASEAFTGDPASVVALGFFVLFLSGVFQVVFGVFRLGGVVKFISYPVIAGIMNGTVIVLLIGAVGEFLGIPKDYSNLSQLPGQVKPFTILVAAVSMLLWLYGKRIVPVIPGPALGLLGGTILFYLLEGLGITVGETIESVPAGLPVLDHLVRLPSILDESYWQHYPLLIATALTLAILSSVESLLAVLTIQNLSGQRPNGNRELVGQGLGNIANAVFGAIPAGGAPSRVKVNFDAGGRTRWSGIMFAVITLLLIVVFAKYIGMIPRAVVAGMTVVVALIVLDKWSIRLVRHILKGDVLYRREYLWNLAIMGGVAGTVIVFDILTAVVIGVLTSVVVFIIQMSKSVVRNVFDGSRIHSSKLRHIKTMDALRSQGGKIAVVELQGPLFFGSTDRLLQQIDELVESGTKYIILDFKRVNDADISAATVLTRTLTQLKQKGVTAVLSYLHKGTKLWTFLDDLGFLDTENPLNLFADTDHALERCEDLMLAELSGTVTLGASRGLEELLGLENLDNSEKAVLHDLVSKKRIPGGEPLCRQGDPGDCIFIIESGSAEISINIPGQNRRRRLATLEAGAIFGEMALLDQGMRSANVQALDDIDCYEISREEFERLKNEYPQIALVILERLGRILVSRLRVANETIGELER